MKNWIYVAAVLGAVAFWQFNSCAQFNRGALEQKIKAREQVIAVLAKQKARVDTVKAQATAVYVPQKSRWDSVKVTLKNPVAIVAEADITIKKCEAVISSCEQQVAIRDGLILQKDSLITDLKKRKPSRFGCSAPFVATTKGLDLGLACGVRFP